VNSGGPALIALLTSLSSYKSGPAAGRAACARLTQHYMILASTFLAIWLVLHGRLRFVGTQNRRSKGESLCPGCQCLRCRAFGSKTSPRLSTLRLPMRKTLASKRWPRRARISGFISISAKEVRVGQLANSEHDVIDIAAPDSVAAWRNRQIAAKLMHYMILRAEQLIGANGDLVRPLAFKAPRAYCASGSHDMPRKSSGTSPKVFRISASSNSPRSGLPRR
jgi:hypothetical protein